MLGTPPDADLDALNAEIEQLKANNLRLVKKFDLEYLTVVSLQGRVRDLECEPERLQTEIKRLNTLEHNCQQLKANGDRCTRPAKGRAKHQGIEINVCLQHQKTVER